MPALTYEDLGGISGVSQSPKAPGSSRSRDRNDKQRIAFAADPNRRFTGIINLQASVGDPNRADQDTLWFDISEMIINDEGGSWSFEPVGEFSALRVICRDGNYWTSSQGTAAATVATSGDFTIDGISVVATISDTAALLAVSINSTPGISGINVIADTVDTTILRIYKTDGTDLVLADTTNTPLVDMGFVPGTFQPGVITKIRMLR